MDVNNIRAFKFRSGNSNNLDAIFENYIWFSQLSELNDPYEGYAFISNEEVDDDFRERFLASVYAQQPNNEISPEEEAKINRQSFEKKAKNAFAKYIDSIAEKQLREFYEEHKNNLRIFSLSLAKDIHEFAAPLNNMLMWAHYADGFKGFCIEFNFSKLKNSIEIAQNIKLGQSQVDYSVDGKLPVIKIKTFMQTCIDNSKDQSFEIIEAFTKKEQSWQYENEVRFLSEKGGKLFYSPDCVNAIYVSENAPNWLKNSLMSYVVMMKSFEIKLYIVSLHNSEYKFGYRRVDV